MPEERPPIPQPTPLLGGPVPEPTPEAEPRLSGPVRVLEIAPEGTEELVALFKGVYRIEPGGELRPAEESEDLDKGGTPHDPMEGREGEPSWKTLPELVGWKTGTDLVVQGSARPRRPVPSMEVAVSVGHQRLVLSVTGRRWMDRVGARVVFSDPEPFEALPLRWEYAYGGRDPAFEADVLAGLEEETLRRAVPAYEGVYGAAAPQPAEYPRNPFGMGWVLGGDDGKVKGREAPRIERPDDRLTPDRAMVNNLFRWAEQPIPGGFDYVPPSAFPRSAMIGLPPASAIPFEQVPEVSRGLLPPDFCRGNAFSTPPERYPDLIHPLASRCAPHGLQLPFLRGDEPILLEGMDPDHPSLRLALPRQRPVFLIPFSGHAPIEVPGALLLVSIGTEERLVRMIWSARVSLSSPLPPGRSSELEERIQIRMQEW